MQKVEVFKTHNIQSDGTKIKQVGLPEESGHIVLD